MMCTVLAPERDFISADSLSYLPSSPNTLDCILNSDVTCNRIVNQVRQVAWSLAYLIKDAIARDVTVYYAISVKVQKKKFPETVRRWSAVPSLSSSYLH